MNYPCDFVIDATGRQATFARKYGAKRIFDDKLVAIYRFLPSDPVVQKKPENIPACASAQDISTLQDTSTLIESHSDGWWYSAYLPDKRWVVALMCDGDLAKEGGYKYAAPWLQILRKSPHTYRRLAPFLDDSTLSKTLCEMPSLTAAHSQCLDNCTGNAWLAVGDAASAYDPLSSLGIFKAFRSAIYASYAVSDYFFPSATQPTQPTQLKETETKKMDYKTSITKKASSLKSNTASQQVLAKYQYVVKQEYHMYRIKQREYYAEEQRFKTPFWQRRCVVSEPREQVI